MRIEEGIVKSIYNGRAVVEIRNPDQEECARCGICVSASDRVKLLDVKAVSGLETGDKVTLQVDIPSPYKGIFLLLFLPLVAFISGCMLGARVEFILPELPNLRMGLFGLLFFSLSLGLASLYDRHIRSRGLSPPEILSIEGRSL